jgi:hypothetical protein
MKLALILLILLLFGCEDSSETTNSNPNVPSTEIRTGEVQIENKDVEIILKNDFPFEIKFGNPMPDFSRYTEIKIKNNFVIVEEGNFITDLDITQVGSYELVIRVLDVDRFTILKEIKHQIDVVDEEPPVIVHNFRGTTYELGTTNIRQPYCTDNYDEECKLEISGNYVNFNEIGKYDFTLTAVDSSGNKASEVFSIEIVDTTKPQIRLLGSSVILHDVNKPFNDPKADIIDNDINVALLIEGDVDISTLGDYTLNYTAIDTSGNKSETVFRTVKVVDREAPVFENYSLSSTIEFKRGIKITPPTCRDNYDASCLVVAENDFDNTILGVQELIYSAVDSSGNKSELKVTVNLVDTTKPTIELIGSSSIVLDWKQNFNDHGVTYNDNFNDEMEVIIDSDFDRLKPGEYTIRYTVSDSSGNQASTIRKLFVKGLEVLAETPAQQPFEIALDMGNSFVFVSTYSSNRDSSILITDRNLQTLNYIVLDNNDFQIRDAKIHEGMIFISGNPIRSNYNDPFYGIRVYSQNGILDYSIETSFPVNTIEFMDDGNIILSELFGNRVNIIDRSGTVLEEYDFDDLDGSFKILPLPNGKVVFVVSSANLGSNIDPGILILDRTSSELTRLRTGRYQNAKIIDGSIIVVGDDVLKLNLNGEVIDGNGLRSSEYHLILSQSLTDVVEFSNGYLFSGYGKGLIFMDSDLNIVWGYQLVSSSVDIGESYYSKNIVVFENKILVSGNLGNPILGDGLLSLIEYK